MFKDLKEYKEITRIYNESVNISEEQREFNKCLDEQEFTEEEALYVIENIDEVTAIVINDLQEEFQALTEQTLTEEDYLNLQEILGSAIAAGVGRKVVSSLARKAGPVVRKGIKKVGSGLKDTLSGAGSVAKSAATKVGGALKGAAKFATKLVPGVALGAGAVKVAQAIGNRSKKNKEIIKKAKDAELDKKIKDGIASTGMGDKGTAITQKGREQAAFNRGERKARVDLKDPTLNDNVKKTETPKATETKPTETKVKKMHPIEKKNRARFGDAHVDKLKSKQTDFKAMRKGTMSKDDFIKKYPKSITAQKSKGLRDHTEWDAYDMVLEYLFSTEQVTSLEEANYVMMEMDQETIGSIVAEVKYSLDEGFVDNFKAGAKKVGSLVQKGVDAVKSAADNVKGKVEKRVERRKENVAINTKIKEKQSQPDASSGKTKAQVMALNRKKEKLNNPKEYAKKQAMSGREKAQALAKARIAAKEKANQPRGRVG